MEAYIRMGNESVIAPSYVLNQLILKGMHRTYDELISEYDFKDYAFSKLRERYKAWTGNSMEEKLFDSFDTVSYTHLDVYKRQALIGDTPDGKGFIELFDDGVQLGNALFVLAQLSLGIFGRFRLPELGGGAHLFHKRCLIGNCEGADRADCLLYTSRCV